MTENNAAQAAEQDPLSDEYVNAVIRQHGYDSPETVIARLWQWIGLNGGENSVTLLMYEAHKALSKLRAEGVQAGDKRALGYVAILHSPCGARYFSRITDKHQAEVCAQNWAVEYAAVKPGPWPTKASPVFTAPQAPSNAQTDEALAHLRTIAGFGGNLQQAKELAKRGLERCAALASAPVHTSAPMDASPGHSASVADWRSAISKIIDGLQDSAKAAKRYDDYDELGLLRLMVWKASAPVADAVDAARYRWLRRWKGQEHEPPFTVQHEEFGTLWLGDLDHAIDAALASAPVAGEAIYQIKLPGDTESGWHDATEGAYWTATEKARRIVYAAPQASEAVRNEDVVRMVYRLRAAVQGDSRASSTVETHQEAAKAEEDLVAAIRAMTTQADKDDGDCAKGAGDVHFIAGTIVTHLNCPLDPAGVMAAARAITAWAHRTPARTEADMDHKARTSRNFDRLMERT